MEDASNAFEIAGRAESLLRKPRVHSHVRAEHAHVGTSFPAGAIDLRVGDPQARLCFEYIRASRDRPLVVETRRRHRRGTNQFLERLPQRQHGIRRQAEQPFELQQPPFDHPRLHPPIGLELLFFDAQHVAIQWTGRALVDARCHQGALAGGGREQLPHDGQRADGRGDFAVLHPDVG